MSNFIKLSDEINRQDKTSVFNFLCDASGNYKREKRFANNFPEIYNEFKCVVWEEDRPFIELMWHFLQDDIDLKLGRCVICGKLSIWSPKHCGFRVGYHKHCSRECVNVDDEINLKRVESYKKTCMERYGDTTVARQQSTKDKSKLTRIKNYGSVEESYRIGLLHNQSIPFNPETTRKTMFITYGCVYYSQTKEWKMKMSEIWKERGEDIGKKISKTKQGFTEERKKELIEKTFITRKMNGTLNSSSYEKILEKYFIDSNIKYISQYKSSLYPFACDFYLPDYDLYVEIQGNWTHGGHPFNHNDKNDIDKLNLWKNKCSKYYDNAINVWTERDPHKRQVAKENNLKLIEIFINNKKDDVISLFNLYFINILYNVLL